MFNKVGGSGNGQLALVVAVDEDVETVSVVDAEFCVVVDDGLVLFLEETVFVLVDSSLSIFSVDNVSLNRFDLCIGGLDCEILP